MVRSCGCPSRPGRYAASDAESSRPEAPAQRELFQVPEPYGAPLVPPPGTMVPLEDGPWTLPMPGTPPTEPPSRLLPAPPVPLPMPVPGVPSGGRLMTPVPDGDAVCAAAPSTAALASAAPTSTL